MCLSRVKALAGVLHHGGHFDFVALIAASMIA
jgi:hypothetical protein